MAAGTGRRQQTPRETASWPAANSKRSPHGDAVAGPAYQHLKDSLKKVVVVVGAGIAGIIPSPRTIPRKCRAPPPLTSLWMITPGVSIIRRESSAGSPFRKGGITWRTGSPAKQSPPSALSFELARFATDPVHGFPGSGCGKGENPARCLVPMVVPMLSPMLFVEDVFQPSRASLRGTKRRRNPEGDARGAPRPAMRQGAGASGRGGGRRRCGRASA
jgi:hypothetical protein